METNDDYKPIEGIFKPEAAVLADGDTPCRFEVKEALSGAPFVVCCDGAAVSCLNMDRVPDAIVGDGDSLPESLKKEYHSIFHFSADQETNDQTKAIEYLRSLGKRRVMIFGATGKREDHTLGNISLLIEYMRKGMDVRSVTDYGVFIPCTGKCLFRTFVGQQLSIFNFGASSMKAHGLKYPIYDFTSWWQGTLNQAMEEAVSIEADGEYIVFMAFDAKK